MLYIDPEASYVKTAESRHYQLMRCYVRRKIGLGKCKLSTCVICQADIRKVSKLPDVISDFLGIETNLDRILRGTPADLLSVNDGFWRSVFGVTYDYATWLNYFKAEEDGTDDENIAQPIVAAAVANEIRTRDLSKFLKRVLNYSWFSDKSQVIYNAYSLTSALGRETCTYCNRAYTHTIIRQKDQEPIIRPTLDHWFPKYNHPLLAVSFYNLIPACPTCNSYVKGSAAADLDSMTHPYNDPTQTRDFEFGYYFEYSLDQYHIFLRNLSLFNEKAKSTLEQMHIHTIYEAHQTELRDLLTIQKNYTGSYIKSLKKMLGDNLTTNEVYRIAFGTELNEKDFHKRPLSKFKHDILRQLGLLITEE